MQKIRIDFDNPGLPQHISAVENDSQSRFFQATLYENGKAYTAPAGATYSIMYHGFGPQNQGWYDTINDGAGKRAACTVSGNVVTCKIARQALQVPGHVSIVLCVTTGKGYMLKSWPIECDCKNDRYDSTAEIESFFYITQISNADWNRAIQAVEELKNTIDPTLSLSGKAADAKAAGDAVGQLKEDVDNVSNSLNSGFVNVDDYILCGVKNGALVESSTSLLSPAFDVRDYLGTVFEIIGEPDIRLVLAKNEESQTGLHSYGWEKSVTLSETHEVRNGYYYGRIAINTKVQNESKEQAQRRIESLFICNNVYFNRLIGQNDIRKIYESLDKLKSVENSKGRALRFELLPIESNGTYRFNSSSFVQDNTVVYNGNQYVIVVNEEKNPIILKRKYPNGEWDSFDLSTISGNPLNSPTENDQHNTYSLGIDRNGYIHIAGNMHANKLKYVISTKPENISEWKIGTMIGAQEDAATYPVFILMPSKNLLFIYRNGTSSNGNTYVNLYDADKKEWKRQSQIFNGAITDENAYINRVAVDYKTGYIHLMYCWRKTGESNTNNDICYCLSKDEGKTWGTTNGTIYDGAITHLTSEIIVDTEDSGSGLLNQSGLDVDLNGNPHGCFMMYDKNGFTQYYHVWYDGLTWHNDQITNWNHRMEFVGGFTQGEICRPSIAISKSNRIFIIYRNSNLSENTLRMMEILKDGVTDFDIVKLNLQNYEYTFDYKSLKDNDKLISIVSNAIAGNWIKDADKKEWWNTQYTALLTIDLSQIDYLISGAYPLPQMEISDRLRFFDHISDNNDFTEIQGLSIIAKKSSQLFVRSSLYAKANDTLVIGYRKQNTVTKILSIPKSGEYKFYYTPWIFVSDIEADQIIDIDAKGNGDIKIGSIEFGVIDNI